MILTQTSLAFTILSSRSSESIWFTIGALVSMVVGKFLKRFFKQPRPSKISGKGELGFPSSHSMNLTFYATYILLRFGRVYGLAVFLIVAAMLYWRVAFRYHTFGQIVGGFAFGVPFTLIWKFLVMEYFHLPQQTTTMINKITGMEFLT